MQTTVAFPPGYRAVTLDLKSKVKVVSKHTIFVFSISGVIIGVPIWKKWLWSRNYLEYQDTIQGLGLIAREIWYNLSTYHFPLKCDLESYTAVGVHLPHAVYILCMFCNYIGLAYIYNIIWQPFENENSLHVNTLLKISYKNKVKYFEISTNLRK